jgi:hypothetical protein
MGRIRSRLTYANVVSSIALVLALGGGYAFAFQGHGSLLSANNAVAPHSPETLLTLPGIGTMTLDCDASTRPSVKLHSTASKTLVARDVMTKSGDQTLYSQATLSPDSGDPVYFTGASSVANPVSTHHISIFPASTAKRPQAEVILNLTKGCKASALVLSTEE